MKRLVHIGFRHGNIIFKTTRNRFVHLMDDTQCRITIFHGIHKNTHCKQVIDLIQCLILIHHLLINTEEMFHTSLYICFDMRIFHVLLYFRHNGFYIFFPDTSLISNLRYQIIIDLRLEVFQCKVIQLDLHLGNTKTLCNRRIDIHGLACFFLLFLRTHIFQSPHVMQTVSKFDQDHTDILRHGQKHFS